MPTAHNLCLHYLDPTGARRLAVTPEQLRAMVSARLAAGNACVPLSSYLTKAPSPQAFSLSFDDAHASVLRHAAPVLSALGVPATLFVPTGSVGRSEEFLSWDELRALRDLGWTLGAHTVSHPRMSWRLYDEDLARYQQRLDDECARAREAMERALGTPIELFAYPYGEAPDAAREAVRRAGYRAAFTVREDLAWDGDLLRVPRVDATPAPRLTAGDHDPLPISVVVPAFERVEILTEVVRRLARQSYPSDRFEVLVVDDGSSSDLSPALRGAPEHIRLVAHDEASATFRAGHARQRGVERARHGIVAFLDADVAVGEDFLWHLDWVHQRVPRCAMLGYLSGYNLHDLGYMHTLADVAPREVLDGELAVIPDRAREPTLRRCLDNLDWITEPWRLCYTGNLSLPRALLDEIGGFSRDFSGWGLEDIDLGVRLTRARAQWVFSRFAVGYHLLDPREPSPRNPFRRASPTLDDFAGYLQNLARLRSHHADVPGVGEFCDRSLDDVRETCGRPDTAGVDLGANEVPLHEALDRVAYARKVGAARLYVLGDDVFAHPAIVEILRFGAREGIAHLAVEAPARSVSGAPLARCQSVGLGHVVLRPDGATARELVAAHATLAAHAITADVIVPSASEEASLRTALAALGAGTIKVSRA